MAREERRHTGIGGGSYTEAQETSQPSSTQENCSEHSLLRSEAERLLHRTSASSSAIAQPSTSSGAVLQHCVVSDEAWNDILNEWYEKIMGNPTNPQVPAANGYAEWTATKHHAEGKAFHDDHMHTAENRTGLPHPASSSGACDDAVPSTSCTDIGASPCGRSNVR
ncbi:hypothetical protein MRX96_014983 [Rhipicephalus microplus]